MGRVAYIHKLYSNNYLYIDHITARIVPFTQQMTYIVTVAETVTVSLF